MSHFWATLVPQINLSWSWFSGGMKHTVSSHLTRNYSNRHKSVRDSVTEKKCECPPPRCAASNCPPPHNHPSIHHSVISAAIAIALSGSFCNLRLFRPSQPLTASSISLPLASGDSRPPCHDAVWRHDRAALIWPLLWVEDEMSKRRR